MSEPSELVLGGQEWRDRQVGEYWLARRGSVPRLNEAEEMALENVLQGRPVKRVLDLGTGGGALLMFLKDRYAFEEAVGIDISPFLLERAGEFTADDPRVRLLKGDLAAPLPEGLGEFDIVLSALTIHHLADERKASLHAEIRTLLAPGGIFVNIDVVTVPTAAFRSRSKEEFAYGSRDAHPSDQPAPLASHFDWLAAAGFVNVDCPWKWLQLAVMVGETPAVAGEPIALSHPARETVA